MNEKSMIDDIVAQLDAGFSGDKAVGHFNVDIKEGTCDIKEVQTLGCTDCNSNSMACSVPTLHEGLDIHDDMDKE